MGVAGSSAFAATGGGNPNDPFELSEERRFSYLGSPALRIEIDQGILGVRLSPLLWLDDF
jgi:hypothetical protein